MQNFLLEDISSCNFDLIEEWIETVEGNFGLRKTHYCNDSVRQFSNYHGLLRTPQELCNLAKQSKDSFHWANHDQTFLNGDFPSFQTELSLRMKYNGRAHNMNMFLLCFALQPITFNPSSINYFQNLLQNLMNHARTDGLSNILPQEHAFLFDINRILIQHLIPTDLTTEECFDKPLNFLASGTNSKIYTTHLNKNLVAVKMLKNDLKDVKKATKELNLELAILMRVNHTHIITPICAGGFSPVSNNTNSKLFIVLEYLPGATLQQIMHPAVQPSPLVKCFRWCSGQGVGPLSLLQALLHARDTASALQYLHRDCHEDLTIIHRDLKPDNIGFNSHGQLKLLDFGLAVCVRKSRTASEAFRMTGCTGSLRYMAPEVGLEKPYNEKVDIYSFGVILWQLTSGVLPFEGIRKADFADVVMIGGERPKIRNNLPKELKDLIAACWQENFSLRPTAYEVCQSLEGILMGLQDENGANNTTGQSETALLNAVTEDTIQNTNDNEATTQLAAENRGCVIA